MSQQGTIKGYGFVHGKLGESGVVEKCAMYHYPHVCTPRWCSPPPEGHPSACPKCGATQRTSYLSACWPDTDEWHGGMKVPPVAMIPDAAAPAPQAEGTRGVVKNRTVEGGKEFWDHVENIVTNFQPPKAGAAPADTARPVACYCDGVPHLQMHSTGTPGCVNNPATRNAEIADLAELRERLEKQWLAQDKLSDFRNWLVWRIGQLENEKQC